MKTIKVIIAYVLLFFYSFTQLADLHALSHDANDTDCMICMHVFDSLDDDFDIPQSIDFIAVKSIPTVAVTTSLNNEYIYTFVHHSFLNKAPPTV